MDIVFFPRGPEGAHQLRNDAAEPARILMWSTIVVPTVSVYPDSDKIGVWTEGKVDDGLFVRSSAVPYFTGETRRPPARPSAAGRSRARPSSPARPSEPRFGSRPICTAAS